MPATSAYQGRTQLSQQMAPLVKSALKALTAQRAQALRLSAQQAHLEQVQVYRMSQNVRLARLDTSATLTVCLFQHNFCTHFKRCFFFSLFMLINFFYFSF